MPIGGTLATHSPLGVAEDVGRFSSPDVEETLADKRKAWDLGV